MSRCTFTTIGADLHRCTKELRKNNFVTFCIVRLHSAAWAAAGLTKLFLRSR